MPISFEDVLAGPELEPAAILDIFLEWVAERDIELYEAQEEALFEIVDGNHVVLNTPTGSGKSLVAVAMHLFAAARRKRSFYTSPIKALVSEKFFSLCETFGAENVGMMTGDGSINSSASIVCCTAEVLANMCLRRGDETGVDYVIMDEFHYYSDRDRGWAWQVPLLTMPSATFLLMSATLGDTKPILEGLERETGREAALVSSDERPVPLHFEYVEHAIHETISDISERSRTPAYVVNFTQRECAEMAQAFTSINFATKEEKYAIRDELKGFRFDSPYGKDVRRFVRSAIGIHHAGLLPKYRLLVERLAQKGMLKVIVGTDTLGVGINVPIRSVLFTRLYKYDGHSTSLLSVRDFKQIAGRAGRRGFDDVGFVYCQAPEHVIENKKAEAKAKRGKKVVKSSPPRGYVQYNEDTFARLQKGSAEQLEPRFDVNHAILVQLLQSGDGEARDGYERLFELIEKSHLNEYESEQLRERSAELLQSLVDAGLVEFDEDEEGNETRPFINAELQDDFSLFHSLSLYLVESLEHLNQSEETYALDVLTMVESIIENPRAVLFRQVDLLKTELINRLKAEGVDYEDRMAKLEEVTWLKPNEELIYETFNDFARRHPWVAGENVKPKSIARDMIERYMNFTEYVQEYGLSRSEGVLLRYLSQVYKALIQNIPSGYVTDELLEVQAYLRTVIGRADSSLIEEWEAMSGDGERPDTPADEPELPRVAPEWANEKAVRARIRAEMHELVRALSAQDWEAAEAGVRGDEWDAEAFEGALGPFFGQYAELRFDHASRFPKWTKVEREAPRLYTVTQTLLDNEDDNFWFVRGVVDFTEPPAPEEPWITVREISS